MRRRRVMGPSRYVRFDVLLLSVEWRGRGWGAGPIRAGERMCLLMKLRGPEQCPGPQPPKEKTGSGAGCTQGPAHTCFDCAPIACSTGDDWETGALADRIAAVGKTHRK